MKAKNLAKTLIEQYLSHTLYRRNRNPTAYNIKRSLDRKGMKLSYDKIETILNQMGYSCYRR